MLLTVFSKPYLRLPGKILIVGQDILKEYMLCFAGGIQTDEWEQGDLMHL
jgi:hypothetical protein